VPGLILAAVSPDNTPAGYNWTFAFPGLLFIVIALVLYALFSRPHRRIPRRPIGVTSAGSRVPDATTARTTATSQPATTEPGGAHLTGRISVDDEAPEGGGESQPGTGDSA